MMKDYIKALFELEHTTSLLDFILENEVHNREELIKQTLTTPIYPYENKMTSGFRKILLFLICSIIFGFLLGIGTLLFSFMILKIMNYTFREICIINFFFSTILAIILAIGFTRKESLEEEVLKRYREEQQQNDALEIIDRLIESIKEVLFETQNSRKKYYKLNFI